MGHGERPSAEWTIKLKLDVHRCILLILPKPLGTARCVPRDVDPSHAESATPTVRIDILRCPKEAIAKTMLYLMSNFTMPRPGASSAGPREIFMFQDPEAHQIYEPGSTAVKHHHDTTTGKAMAARGTDWQRPFTSFLQNASLPALSFVLQHRAENLQPSTHCRGTTNAS